MEESGKKKLMLTILMICVGLAVAVTMFTGGGIGGDAGPSIQLLCANQECGHSFKVSTKKYNEMIADMMDKMDPEAGGQAMTVFYCPECDEKSLFVAIKCGNKTCGAVFFPAYGSQDRADRCPECGFSKSEEAGKSIREK